MSQNQQQYDLLRSLVDATSSGTTVSYHEDDFKLRPHERRKVTRLEVPVDSLEQYAALLPRNTVNIHGGEISRTEPIRDYPPKLVAEIISYPAEPSNFVNVNQGIEARLWLPSDTPTGIEAPSQVVSALLPSGKYTLETGVHYPPGRNHIEFVAKAIQAGQAKPFNKPPAGK